LVNEVSLYYDARSKKHQNVSYKCLQVSYHILLHISYYKHRFGAKLQYYIQKFKVIKLFTRGQCMYTEEDPKIA